MPVSAVPGSAVRRSRTAPATSPSTITAQVASPRGPSSPGRRSRWWARSQSTRGDDQPDPAPTGGVTSAAAASWTATATSRARTSSSTATNSTRRGSGIGSGDVGELAAQVQDGLRVQLADPALGHAEHPADVGQGEALEVVQADDDLLPLGELLHGAGQQLTGLPVL